MRIGVVIVALFVKFALGGEYGHDYESHAIKPEQCTTRKVQCPSYQPFPLVDGTCNNLKHPTWGATNTHLPRLLPAEYSDSRGKPRSNGVFGKLPLPRSVSNALKESEKSFSSEVSHLHVVFGQLVVHDIVLTTAIKNEDGTDLDCDCDRPKKDCINIGLPEGDIQKTKANRKCMKLSRSKIAIGVEGCTFAQREQINAITSALDLTFIYGKTEKETKELRDPASNTGELKMVENPASASRKNLPNQDQLKEAVSKTMDCPVKIHTPKDIPCFVAGDVRSNENPGLVSLITIWARYHNYVARNVKLVNMGWDSDEVFNVARRIVSAIYQSIVYREYLPLLLGPEWMQIFDLKPVDGFGFWDGYDPEYNLAIANEFATAAFRYGHSRVAANLSRPNSFFKRGTIPDIPLAGTFFTNDHQLEKRGGGAGAILRGFIMDKAEKTDPTLVDALRNQLFTELGDKFGKDLFAINIQRGRDHGLPGYNKYRTICGLPKANSFSDLSDEIPKKIISGLKRVYQSVDDIDLFPGGLSEKPVKGGQVGPTFACILAYGFRALRKGDRFWHELANAPSSFTGEQLASIRQTTFASVLCEVGEDMKFVKKFPMRMEEGKYGRIVSCDSIQGLDIFPWRSFQQAFHRKKYDTITLWTTWFVTKFTDKHKVDIRREALRTFAERPEDTCENRFGYELREVPKSNFIQIRFSCLPGTIASTDFPFQISPHHYWTDWIHTDDHEQVFEPSQFACHQKVVAIQAMSGKKFARWTDDVFEKYGPKSGFACRNEHQLSGKCHRYRIRALCSGTKKVFKHKQIQHEIRSTPKITPHRSEETSDETILHSHLYPPVGPSHDEHFSPENLHPQ
ncbi:salivary peroxidase/catechol oxidase-like [Styela clava]